MTADLWAEYFYATTPGERDAAALVLGHITPFNPPELDEDAIEEREARRLSWESDPDLSDYWRDRNPHL